jgi:hypothetical protein
MHRKGGETTMDEKPQTDVSAALSRPATAAGTIANDADEKRVVPPHYIREKIHTGHGNFVWSEPFDPAERVKEEAEARRASLAQRGTFPEPEPAKPNEVK